MSKTPLPRPTNVQLLPESIIIQWDDGFISSYEHRYLRLNCRCAVCVGEWPSRREIDESLVPRDVYALEYTHVGQYALQFLWSDVHYTGIYTYELLRKLGTNE
jgi:DUF971 family protein